LPGIPDGRAVLELRSDMGVVGLFFDFLLFLSMKFNPDKCEVSSITGKRNPLMFPSTLYNKELNTTDATKYLGVAISKDLKKQFVIAFN
jgi:hypothetical protein